MVRSSAEVIHNLERTFLLQNKTPAVDKFPRQH
jgi:hypothetical protein